MKFLIRFLILSLILIEQAEASYFSKIEEGGFLNVDWGTFLGGSKSETIKDIAIDSGGNIILIGYTYSKDMPTNNGIYKKYNGGDNDIYVAKLSPNGSLIWATYIGGKGDDRGHSVSIDKSDNVIITGYSNSKNIPLINSYCSENKGGNDIYVAKISSDGNRIIWSTFVGGDRDDEALSVGIDSFDNVIIAGHTESKNIPTINAFSNIFKGGMDIYIAKLSADGKYLLYATYIGGKKDDFCFGMDLDKSDNIIFAGFTNSPDLPTPNGFQNFLKGTENIYIGKMSEKGNLLWATYLGGSKVDRANSVFVDFKNDILIAGRSNSYDIPKINSYQSYLKGKDDIYLARISSDGKEILWSTYVGASNNEEAYDVVSDKEGNVYFCGKTESKGMNYFNPIQDNFAGEEDIYFGVLSNDGTSLLFATYLGGGSNDIPFAIAVDKDENIIIGAEVESKKLKTNRGIKIVMKFKKEYDIFLLKFRHSK